MLAHRAMPHLTLEELEAGLDAVRASPDDEGTLDLIVCRPSVGERTELAVAELSVDEGLVGDNWKARGSKRTEDGSAHPEMQLNIMNARAAALVAGDAARRRLAGDQLYVDLNLSDENLRPGTKLAIGTAVIVVTAVPHNGCKKFAQRFGQDAVRFVNSPEGKRLHLRGINARVVQGGTIRLGDAVTKRPSGT